MVLTGINGSLVSGRTDTASMFTKTGQHQTAFGAGDFVIFLWARTVSWLSTSKWLLPKFRKCWAESGVWVAAQWARLRFLRSMRVGPVRASLPKGGNPQLTISKTYMSKYAVKCLGPQVCLFMNWRIPCMRLYLQAYAWIQQLHCGHGHH